MSDINIKYVIDQYRSGLSTSAIAKDLGTYAKKIERILKKNNEPIRSKSESAKLAIKSGRSTHPTKGKKRTAEEKLAISKGREKAWKNMPDEDREKFRQEAKERWDNVDPLKKREWQEKAGRELQKTTKNGSRQERLIADNLRNLGYTVVTHKKGLIGGKFEIDLLLPELNTIIEVDGPQHFLPVFGEAKLAETIKADAKKSGLLIAKGFCVVRVKYLRKSMSQAVARRLWDSVYTAVQAIEKKFPPKSKRFIELEID